MKQSKRIPENFLDFTVGQFIEFTKISTNKIISETEKTIQEIAFLTGIKPDVLESFEEFNPFIFSLNRLKASKPKVKFKRYIIVNGKLYKVAKQLNELSMVQNRIIGSLTGPDKMHLVYSTMCRRFHFYKDGQFLSFHHDTQSAARIATEFYLYAKVNQLCGIQEIFENEYKIAVSALNTNVQYAIDNIRLIKEELKNDSQMTEQVEIMLNSLIEQVQGITLEK